MKILYINAMGPTEKAPLGGIFVSQRIRALRKLGVEIVPVNVRLSFSPIVKLLLSLKKIKDNGKPIDHQLGVEYETVTVKLNLFEFLKARKDGSGYRSALRRDLYGVLNQDIDLIHLHWCWPVGFIVSEFSKEKDIPYVLTFHGSDINIQLQSLVIRPMLLKMMEEASSVEFISNALLQRAVKAGYSGKNAVVIYNGIDTEVFFPKKTESEKKRVGFVGNLIPVKGADRLPAIFSEINKRCTMDIQFIVVGKGNLLDEIKSQTKDLDIHFPGQLAPEKLAEVYNGLDLLIVPSRSEGYSCVIKEAQACGVMVVATGIGGIPEAVGDYGKLIFSEDEDELIIMLAESAVEYLEKKSDIDVMKMVSDAKKCSWMERQKKSLENYEGILEKNRKTIG